MPAAGVQPSAWLARRMVGKPPSPAQPSPANLAPGQRGRSTETPSPSLRMTEGPAADGRYEREHAPGKAENRRGSVVVTRSLTLRGTRYRSASELSRVHELAELLVRCRWQADADLSDVRPHTRAAPCTQYYHPPFSLRPGDPQMQGRQAGSGGTGQSEASARRRPRRVGAQLFFFFGVPCVPWAAGRGRQFFVDFC